MNGPAPNLRRWRPQDGREPVVRIGVVLADDAITVVDLEIPPQGGYTTVATAGDRGDGGAPEPSGRRLQARLAEGGIELAVDGEAPRLARSWTIAPQVPRPPARGEGVLVRGVVAGRGFHWQKRVDQTLSRRLELHPVRNGGGLVLVNELPLEDYLASVITSEMSSACPIEFLRAQCVTARSWLLAFTEPKHDADPFDRCNDDCCQRYQGTGDLSDVAIEAARSTRGMVLVAREDPNLVVDANYSKSCGGIVEIPEHIWGRRKPGLAPQVDAPPDSPAKGFLPVTDANLDEYLDGDWLRRAEIYCSPAVIPEDQLGQYLGRVDESGEYFRWSVSYSHDEIAELLRGKVPELESLSRLLDLRVTKRGISGRATEIALSYVDASGAERELSVPDQYRIRQILHPSFLYSSAFAVRIDRDAAGQCRRLTLRGAGWGHGAGLCQIGALGMSLRGIDHERIVHHYFPAATLKRLYQ